MALIKQKSHYTQIPNALLNHKGISLKAKGVWAFVNSKPDGWNYSVKGICSQTKEGRESVTAALKELETFGYLERKPSKDFKGSFTGYDYYLYDEPINEKSVNVKPVTRETSNHSKNIKSNTITSNKKIDVSKENFETTPPKKEVKKPVKKTTPKTKATLFKNSEAYDQDFFFEKLKEFEDQGVDLLAYYQAIEDWNDIKETKRTSKGWIATARTWIRRDAKENKVKKINPLVNPQKNEDDMREFLNMG